MNIVNCPDCHRAICICEKRRTAPSLCYGSCTHLWRVTFDSTFSSSSGMDRYSRPNTRAEVYVTSYDDSLSAVTRVLAKAAGSQQEVEVVSAHYLGKVYVPTAGG